MWMWIGLALVAAAVGFFRRSAYERNQLVTTEYRITLEKLSPEFDGFRLVFLTDLHDKEFGERNERLMEAIRKARPDVVLVGGDMMVARDCTECSTDTALSFVERLAGEFPVYYGYGNHELRLKTLECHRETYEGFYGGLRKAGVCVLDDMSVTRNGTRGSLTVTGLTLPKTAYPRYRKEPLEKDLICGKVGTVGEKDTRILLAHTPLHQQEYAAWGADITLCGHYHGGTINLPLVGGVMSPDLHLFPGICRGRYETAGKTMIVSGGLGTHSVNIRFGNKPEVVVLELTCGKEEWK